MINFAHRGASEYAPENTLSAFYLGLLHGANGIETDVQKTKDGVLVLFHDDTLDRVSDTKGKLSDFTWEELKAVKVYGKAKNVFYDRIVTLRAFLEHFAQYNIHFAIELKGADVEQGTLEIIKEFGILDRVTFTSFNIEYIKKIKELDSSARIGWLIGEINDDAINSIMQIGGDELAPKADWVTQAQIRMCRDVGLGVRAWGVANTDLMQAMCALGVDGMTVNFPDKLWKYENGI